MLPGLLPLNRTAAERTLVDLCEVERPGQRVSDGEGGWLPGVGVSHAGVRCLVAEFTGKERWQGQGITEDTSYLFQMAWNEDIQMGDLIHWHGGTFTPTGIPDGSLLMLKNVYVRNV